MSRTVKDARLESREKRSKLPRAGKPYYRSIDPGLHLGYRKGSTGGRWVVRWYVGERDYRVEAFATADDAGDADGVATLNFAQAQAKAREIFTARKREEAGLPADGGPYTVGKALDDYLIDYDRRGGKGHAEATHAIEHHIRPTLGARELHKLTTEDIKKWFDAVATAPPRARTGAKAATPNLRAFDPTDPDAIRRRRSTANRLLTVLKAALNFAYQSGKITTPRAWQTVKPFRAVDASRVRYFTIEEAKRLINAAAPDFRRLVQAALATGARYGELAALKVGDFNPDSNTLLIRISKGDKFRHVVLNDDGAKVFAALTAGREAAATMLTKDGGGRWLSSHQERPMKAACKAAKIEPACGIHVLRHTWASHAVMNGAPLIVVAKNLGHTSTRMVERHYGHLAPSFISDAIRAAAPSFGFKPDKKVARLRAR